MTHIDINTRVFLTVNLAIFACFWVREIVKEGLDTDSFVFGAMKGAVVVVIGNLALAALVGVASLWIPV